MFSCEIWDIFKNAFFYRTSPVAASVVTNELKFTNPICTVIFASVCQPWTILLISTHEHVTTKVQNQEVIKIPNNKVKLIKYCLHAIKKILNMVLNFTVSNLNVCNKGLLLLTTSHLPCIQRQKCMCQWIVKSCRTCRVLKIVHGCIVHVDTTPQDNHRKLKQNKKTS